MIEFELITLDGKKFSQQVYEVLLPTPDGQIAVLTHHAPLVSIATPGVIGIRHKPTHPDDMIEYFATNGGVIEILDNVVRLLADEADHADEIDEAEAKKAYEKAKELVNLAKSYNEIDEAQSLIDRHATRLKVAELRRHRKQR